MQTIQLRNCKFRYVDKKRNVYSIIKVDRHKPNISISFPHCIRNTQYHTVPFYSVSQNECINVFTCYSNKIDATRLAEYYEGDILELSIADFIEYAKLLKLPMVVVLENLDDKTEESYEISYYETRLMS